MKHVPGPYRATRAMHDGQEQRYWWIDDGHESEPFGNLATVWQGFGREPGQVEATARLLAGSPALLEALDWLVHLHHDVSRGGRDPETGQQYPVTNDEWEDALAFAMEAIARAKGEHDED